MRPKGSSRTVHRLAAKAVAAACLTTALLAPAYAQFWGWGSSPRPQPRYQQQYTNPFGGGFFGQPDNRPAPREREAPVDYSHAPAPPRKSADAAAAVTAPVVVMGDAMADWLAYGLEDALAEKPEFGVVRKHRTTSGLIRYEPRRETEWAQVAREIIAADKPKFIVMMIGVNDRQSIRERAAPARGAARGKAAPAPAPAAQPPQSDPELQAQQSADQQNAEQQSGEPPTAEQQDGAAAPPIATPEPARASSGNYEFRSEKWEAAYIKRIDATIAAMKSANVPVLWVGLPAQRNSRATSDSAYLNELYRQRAEKAGIVYVDVWDGFVDDGGRYSNQGPDFEGQTRRLRSGDGVYFTKAGARKLAHYVEREIQRNISNRTVPIAMPAPEPAVLTPGTRPSGPSPRPVAGPVVPLTASFSSNDELLGGGRAPRPATADPVAVRVLTKGEPITAPTGRADDFSWPRNTVVTAEPGAQSASTTNTSAPAAKTAPAPAAAAPARPRANQTATTATQQRATTEGTSTEAAPPVRRRPRPPAAMTIAPRDDVPRPPGLIGGR